jgi:hypothetical protein
LLDETLKTALWEKIQAVEVAPDIQIAKEKVEMQ